MSGETSAVTMPSYFTNEEWESLCTIVGIDRPNEANDPDSGVMRDPLAGQGDCRGDCQLDAAADREKRNEDSKEELKYYSLPDDSFEDVETFKSCGKAHAFKVSKSATSSFAEMADVQDVAAAPTTPSNCSDGINGPAADWQGHAGGLLEEDDFTAEFGGADEDDFQAFFTIEEAGDLRKMIHPLELELHSQLRSNGEVDISEYFAGDRLVLLRRNTVPQFIRTIRTMETNTYILVGRNHRSYSLQSITKALDLGMRKGSVSPEVSAISHHDLALPKAPSIIPCKNKLKRSSTNSSFIETTPPSPARSHGSSICEQQHHYVDLSSQRRGRSRKWTEGEDEAVKRLVSRHGAGNWVKVASELKSKTPKQVHARWRDYLRPGITDMPWTDDETRKLAALHASIGNSWSQLATLLPGRSANAIKNRVNAARRRRRNNPSAGDAEGLWNYLHEDSPSPQVPYPIAV